MKQSVKYFDAYPKVDAFHVTSDGRFFPEKNKRMAQSHPHALKTGKIEVATRNDAKKETNKTSLKY